MTLRIYDVEENKIVKAVVQRCFADAVIDTYFELIETNQAYRIRICDLKDSNKYVVNSEDLVDLILYLDNEFKEQYFKKEIK